MKAVTAQQMRDIESQWFDSGATTLPKLMDDVGRAIADWTISDLIRHIALANITALAGKGNNGGDAIVAATHLARAGANSAIIICADRDRDDPLLDAARVAGVSITDATDQSQIEEVSAICKRSDVVIDGVLGFSISRPISNQLGRLLRLVRESSRRVAAIDVPSGADASTGHFDPLGLPADVTLSVGLVKIGTAIRFGNPEFGPEHHVLDVGVPNRFTKHISTEVVSARSAANFLSERPATAHKGDFGRTLLLVGSESYIGAAVLATAACARSSVGLLTVAVTPALKPVIAATVPEATFVDLPTSPSGELIPKAAFEKLRKTIKDVDSVLIGCGLGIGDAQRELIDLLVSARGLWSHSVAVVDADALTMLAEMEIQNPCGGRLVVTPHPGEMARLLRTSIASVESDRLGSARQAAEKLGGTVVLKGASTLIANPDGSVRINMRPNSALARGGTGDVLAGLTAGLAAQLPSYDAATLAVYVHSLAGEIAANLLGEYGMTASDVVKHLPAAFRELASLQH